MRHTFEGKRDVRYCGGGNIRVSRFLKRSSPPRMQWAGRVVTLLLSPFRERAFGMVFGAISV